MAESPCGRGRTPSTEAHWRLLRATTKRAPNYRRRCFYTATWGSAKWCPKSLRRSAIAHSTAPL
eukprot:11641266-Alexandrium_andersonii.AAC.1